MDKGSENILLRCIVICIIFGMLSMPTQAIPSSRINDHQSTTGPVPPMSVTKSASSALLDYQVVIPDVPAYLWYNGCGPTASGMIIGYWDGKGFDKLVNSSAKTQTTSVNKMISSSGNYNDYVLPIEYGNVLLPDKSEPPFGDEHPDDSVADFYKTSQSYHGNFYGWSWYSDADNSLRNYALSIDPTYKVTAYNEVWGTFTWDDFRAEIDANHPVELLVDSDGDAWTDHFITAIGYGEQGGKPMYASYNTWDTSIHWYDFSYMTVGKPWGIYGATIFYLEQPPISANRAIENNVMTVGKETNIIVTIMNDNTDRSLSIQEIIPSGWTLTRGIDDADLFKNSTYEWLWNTVSSYDVKTVKYELTAPCDTEPGTYNIDGYITTMGDTISISGDHTVTMSPSICSDPGTLNLSLNNHLTRYWTHVAIPTMMNTTKNIKSLQYTVSFNSSIINADNITLGPSASGASLTQNIDNITGIVNIGIISTTGLSTNGNIANISFLPNSIYPGGCGNNGRYELCTSKLDISSISATDVDNMLLVTGAHSGTLTVGYRMAGDANDDESITSSDALLYLRYAVGQNVSPFHMDISDDVTCDNIPKITAADALKVLRKAVKQNVDLQCNILIES